jgi:succinate dehydrogenase / fumarate reductase, flavoprotein subunit
MRNDTRSVVSNVLIIGSGAAGLRAAIAAHQAGREVNIVGKRQASDAHTVLAAGGINAVLGTRDPEDSWEQHFADTFKEGYMLAHPRMVELLVKGAPEAVLELAEWGCDFARTEDGRLDQRYFGAHKYRRTCYAGDYTGRAILQTLLAKVQELRIPIHEDQYVSRFLVHDGVCFGALSFHIESGKRTVWLADAVVLAAGGHTRIWRRSSSRRDENTGDAIMLALQAGCEVADMELVQFHPTGMVYPEEMAGTLVTEAVRGEGGRLFNSEGERFMERYDPERLELSTRDRVALANYKEIKEGRGGPHGGVFLDITHLPKEQIVEKLPRMYRQFLEALMLNISEERMEVAPTAHYTMGGVVVDPETHATAVQGLFAAGECTSGVHGANRLGGNSLAETLVFGKAAGEHAARHSEAIEAQLRAPEAVRLAQEELDRLTEPGSELARPLQRAIRDVMWEHCGVIRDETGLRGGLEKIENLKKAAENIDVRPSSEGYRDLALALDLKGSLHAAEATLLSALERRESRGAHQREDYPETDARSRVNFRISQDASGELNPRSVSTPEPARELMRLVEETEELTVSGRLVE